MRPKRRDCYWMPPEHADARGLVGVGGDLELNTLIRAYSEGVFPWYNEGDPILWWSPDPRGVMPLDGLHISRRLARTIRSGKFHITVNHCFRNVMQACGANRPEGTWVTTEMLEAYCAAHAVGLAHSLEVWQHPQNATRSSFDSGPAPLLANPTTPHEDGWLLAGGIYGVAIGGLFAGESMFHRVNDGSKIALVSLVQHLRARGFTLFDVQMKTEHTATMGATEIPRAEYLQRLREAVKQQEVRFA